MWALAFTKLAPKVSRVILSNSKVKMTSFSKRYNKERTGNTLHRVVKPSCTTANVAQSGSGRRLRALNFRHEGQCYNALMAKPERYQLPFDFGRRPEQSLVYYEMGFTGHENADEGSGRFVRKLREEVLVRSPYDAAHHLLSHVFTPFEAFDQEELWCLLLNTKNQITHEAMVYRGTVNTVYIRQAELFKEAVRVNAAVVLLSHCHPSGSAEPSPEDVRVSIEAIQAGKILGIELLDHIIVGRDERWVSLKELGAGFEK